MDELELLQLIRMKGLTTAAAVAASLDCTEDAAQAALAALAEAGLLGAIAGRVRLAPAGRERLAVLIAAERATVDPSALDRHYAAFSAVNDEVKAIIAAWQMRGAETRNDHADATYDADVIARLSDADTAFAPTMDSLAVAVPRLSGYRRRLAAALTRIIAGEADYVAKPIMDSYHSVWFELHEDLIALTGRSRAEEAAAGRAA